MNCWNIGKDFVLYVLVLWQVIKKIGVYPYYTTENYKQVLTKKYSCREWAVIFLLKFEWPYNRLKIRNKTINSVLKTRWYVNFKVIIIRKIQHKTLKKPYFSYKNNFNISIKTKHISQYYFLNVPCNILI